MQKKAKQYLVKLTALLKDSGEFNDHMQKALMVLEEGISRLPEEVMGANKVLGEPEELVNSPHGLVLYADGACRGNPGPGSFGVLIQKADGSILCEGTGGENPTTNNRMEISAAIYALEFVSDYLFQNPLESFSPLLLVTDSKYVVDGLNQWAQGWKNRGWKKADGKAPENLDLWQKLDEVRQPFPELRVSWVKGHSGHPGNEYCDQLANQYLDHQK